MRLWLWLMCSIHSSSKLIGTRVHYNMLWPGGHYELGRCLVHKSWEYVGRHDLQIKALKKVILICHQWDIQRVTQVNLIISITLQGNSFLVCSYMSYNISLNHSWIGRSVYIPYQSKLLSYPSGVFCKLHSDDNLTDRQILNSTVNNQTMTCVKH